jgi:hypothetical protein
MSCIVLQQDLLLRKSLPACLHLQPITTTLHTCDVGYDDTYDDTLTLRRHPTAAGPAALALPALTSEPATSPDVMAGSCLHL